VLAVAFVGDGISLVQSLRQARSEAKERGWNVWFHLLRSSDPTVRAVVVEDSAALIGLVIAAVGLLLSHHFGSDRPEFSTGMVQVLDNPGNWSFASIS